METVPRLLNPVGKALWYVESHFEQDLSVPRLASGAPDILTVALDSSNNSHEALTRAFREQSSIWNLSRLSKWKGGLTQLWELAGS